MSFAGVSLIRDGRLCPSAPAINDAGAAGGYHLLVVEGYSRTKADVPHGHHIESGPFRVGGYLWFLKYYPNGSTSARPGSASASIILAQDVAKPVKAQFVMSFIGQSDKQESTYISSTEVCEFPCRSAGMSYLNFVSRDEFEYSQHLKDNSFTLRCDVFVLSALVDAKGAGAASPFVTVPPPDMQRHFTDLLKDKEGADVTFEVGGETIAAHRCVLAARSRVFRAELCGPMKESTAAGYTIHVEDMEPQVFKAMLEFIYNDSEPEIEKDDDEDAMWQWQHLLAAADRYDMQRLKLICEDKLCGFIEVNSMTAILSLAEQHCCNGLKKACYVFLGALGNLRAVAATDGFDDLIRSYPSVMKQLITMLAPF